MKRLTSVVRCCAAGLLLCGPGCALPGFRGVNEVTSPNPYESAEDGGRVAAGPSALGRPQVANAAGWSRTPPAIPAGVAQVGYNHPALPAHASACGCNHGGPSTVGNAHGYAAAPVTPWNLYGADRQEFLCDGGDHPPEAVLLRDGTVAGMEGEDTVVHYETQNGTSHLQASNRVCLYAPRFGSVRKVTGAAAGGRVVGLAQVDRPITPTGVALELPGLMIQETVELGFADVARGIDAMRDRNRGVPVEAILSLEQTNDVMAAYAGLSYMELRQLEDEQKALLQRLALAAITWELDESLEVVVEDLRTPTLTRDIQVQGLTIYDFPDAGRLQILKMADRTDAHPGEIVTFMLRVQNVGDSAVNDVVLIDNLTTRLAYVEESQQADRPVDFEAKPNAEGSEKLIWRLQEALEVGESVTIRFECKVR